MRKQSFFLLASPSLHSKAPRVKHVGRLAITLVLLIGTCMGDAQIDPMKRQLFQAGYNQPLEGKGPIAAYAYYFMNRPESIRTNITLRLAVAPVFLDGELGFKEALGPNTDLGLGLS